MYCPNFSSDITSETALNGCHRRRVAMSIFHTVCVYVRLVTTHIVCLVPVSYFNSACILEISE